MVVEARETQTVWVKDDDGHVIAKLTVDRVAMMRNLWACTLETPTIVDDEVAWEEVTANAVVKL